MSCKKLVFKKTDDKNKDIKFVVNDKEIMKKINLKEEDCLDINSDIIKDMEEHRTIMLDKLTLEKDDIENKAVFWNVLISHINKYASIIDVEDSIRLIKFCDSYIK